MALLLAQNRTMNSYPEPHSDAEPQLAPVVYEQPLNERMRTFLRLEFLYTQASYHSESPNPWSARAAVTSLLEILAITARGDSRSEVLKELDDPYGFGLGLDEQIAYDEPDQTEERW